MGERRPKGRRGLIAAVGGILDHELRACADGAGYDAGRVAEEQVGELYLGSAIGRQVIPAVDAIFRALADEIVGAGSDGESLAAYARKHGHILGARCTIRQIQAVMARLRRATASAGVRVVTTR